MITATTARARTRTRFSPRRIVGTLTPDQFQEVVNRNLDAIAAAIEQLDGNTQLVLEDVGGMVPPGSGPTGAPGNLAETYANGAVAADQTMVILDAKGGGMVLDATTGTYTGSWILDVRRSGNASAAVRAYNVNVGTVSDAMFVATSDAGSLNMVALSSGWTPTSAMEVAAGAGVNWPGTGGLSIAAYDAAGIIRFHTGGTTERARLDALGRFEATGTSHHFGPRTYATTGTDALVVGTDGYYAPMGPSTMDYGNAIVALVTNDVQTGTPDARLLARFRQNASTDPMNAGYIRWTKGGSANTSGFAISTASTPDIPVEWLRMTGAGYTGIGNMYVYDPTTIGRLQVYERDSATSTPTTIMSLYHTISGSVAAGAGDMIQWQSSDQSGTGEEAGRLGFVADSVSAGAFGYVARKLRMTLGNSTITAWDWFTGGAILPDGTAAPTHAVPGGGPPTPTAGHGGFRYHAGVGTGRFEVYDETDGAWKAVVGGSAVSPLTTKGDLWTYTTTDARLAVGTGGSGDGLILTSDSTTATGLKWVAGTTGITILGTVATGTWSATTIALNKGGTGQTTKAAAFDALQPMTTLGDVIYGGASGTGTRLAGDTSNSLKLLTSQGVAGVAQAPAWQTPATAGIPTGTGTAGRIAYWSGTNAIASDSALTYDTVNKRFTQFGDSGGSVMSLKASNGTIASPTANAAGNFLGAILWFGYTDDYYPGAQIRTEAATGWGASGADSPGNLIFMTTPDGSGTSLKRMKIQSDGKIMIGDTTTNATSDVQLLHTQDALTQILAQNLNVSASATAALAASSDAGDLSFIAYSSAATGAGVGAASTAGFRWSGSGSLDIAATNASGVVKVYTGGVAAGNLRMTVSSAGLITVANKITGLTQATGTTDAVAGGRTITASTGLTGTHDLTTDVTLAIAAGGVGPTQLANTAVTPGTYQGTFTVDAQGRLTAASTVEDWKAVQRRRAATAGLATGFQEAYYNGFANTDEVDISTIAGSGAFSLTGAAARGGVLRSTTGATASSVAQAFNIGIASKPLLANPSTDTYYMASRARLTTTPDANTNAVFVGIDDNGAPHAVQLKVKGSNSTTFLTLLVVGAGTTTTTTTGAIDTSWHDFAIYYNGTTFTAYLDGVSIGTAVNTNAGTVATALEFLTVANGATAAAQTMDMDSVIIFTGPN